MNEPNEMNNEQNNEQNNETEPAPMQQPEREQASKPERESYYRFCWDYAEQRQFDQRLEKKKRRGGAWTFAIVMTVAFVLVLGALIGTLIFRDELLNFGTTASSVNTLNAVQIASKCNSGVVMVETYNAQSHGNGTGFFVREDGYIVTNYHVVSEMTSIHVYLHGQTDSVEAELIGYSADDDIAVIKIAGTGYPVLTMGNSDLVVAGETAFAIGNPGGNTWTITQGIISTAKRKMTVTNTYNFVEMTMIQTDTPVNPGNSGGPLINDRGEVIGIVTRKQTDYEALGFAIPINGALKTANELILGEAVTPSENNRVRPTIGVTVSTIEQGEEFTFDSTTYTAQADGVLIHSVTAGGPADGILQAGDIIVKFDGKTVKTSDEMIEVLYDYHGGDRISFEIYRIGETKTRTVKVTLGSVSD